MKNGLESVRIFMQISNSMLRQTLAPRPAPFPTGQHRLKLDGIFVLLVSPAGCMPVVQSTAIAEEWLIKTSMFATLSYSE